MKSCPKCGREYDDPSLNFCLEDGEWLIDDAEDGEPTRSLPGQSDPGEAKTRQKFGTTDETAILPTGAIEESRPRSRRRRLPLTVLGVAIGLLVVTLAGYGVVRWYFGADDSVQERPDLEFERLTGDGNVKEAVISPDGKFLAYLEVIGNEISLRVKQIETNSTIEVLKRGGFEDIRNLTFSPDGNFIYFGGINRGGQKSVYRVATLGGTSVPIPISALTYSLSSDGSRIAFNEDGEDKSESSITVANIDGTGARKVISRKGPQWVYPGSAWSPDGKSLLLAIWDADRLPSPLSLAIYSFEDDSVRNIGSDRWERINYRGYAWDPSGKYVYLTGARVGGEPMQIWRVSISEGKADRLTNREKGFGVLSITADGSRLVTTESDPRYGIWVSPDLDPKNAVEVLPPNGFARGLDWTPDGRIVYISDQSGASEIWSMDADGSNQKQLTNDRIYKRDTSVSPDGKTVVYSSPIDGFQLYTVPIIGGNPSRLNTGGTSPGDPSFSPDGNYIAFRGLSGGKQSIFRISVEGGQVERLTNYFANKPRYSPDGSTIACFWKDPNDKFYSLGIIPSNGGTPVRKFSIPSSTLLYAGPVWTPDGKQITYIVADGEKTDLWAQSVAGGDPVKLTDISRPWLEQRAYSKDGKRIAITRGERLINAIMIKGLK